MENQISKYIEKTVGKGNQENRNLNEQAEKTQQNKKWDLKKILADVFNCNEVPQEERIPMFWGKVKAVKTKYDTVFYCIEKIKSLSGKDIKINPYQKNADLNIHIGKDLPADINEGDEACVVVCAGRLLTNRELLASKTVISLSMLKLQPEMNYLMRLCYLVVRSELSEFKEQMEALLEEHGLKRDTVDVLELLKEDVRDAAKKEAEATLFDVKAEIEYLTVQKKELLDEINMIGEIRDMTGRKNTLSGEIEELKSTKNGLSKEINELEERKKSIVEWFISSNQSDENLPKTPIDKSAITIAEFAERVDYDYKDNTSTIAFLMALSTDQIIALFGPPGIGKTTYAVKMAKALGAKCTVISVQNSWTEGTDLLGYYDPMNNTYVGTRLLDALFAAKGEWEQEKEKSRLHFICLDEMNLARVEYYFADFLSLLQLPEEERWIRLLPPDKEEEVQRYKRYMEKKEEGDSTADNTDEQKLKQLVKYRSFEFPPNVRFVGTLNNDDTTAELSPKVRDRSMFIDIRNTKHGEDRNNPIEDYYPVSFFRIGQEDSCKLSKELMDVFNDENNRFKAYAQTMLTWLEKRVPSCIRGIGKEKKQNVIFSYLIIAKILPLIRRKDEFKYTKYEEANAAFNRASENGLSKEYFDYLGGY